MTQQTRNDLLLTLDNSELAAVDQSIMDAYLAPFATREEYEHAGKLRLHYFAVLATVEYHQHWESIRSASTGRETPKALDLQNDDYCPRCGSGDPDGCNLCGRTVVQDGDTTITTTRDMLPGEFDSIAPIGRFERVVK